MNEERLKVLKMLKEGRITMEEAELLLDALEGGTRGEERGQGSGEARGGERESSRQEKTGGRSGFAGWKGIPEAFLNLDWKLDPKIFESGFREAMKGFEQSMKDFAQDFRKKDFTGGFKEMFGRSAGQATTTVRIATTGAKSVALSNRWGDIRVSGGAAGDIVGSASVTVWAADEGSAEERAEAVEIAHYREGDRIVVRCELPPEYERTRYRVDLDLSLPPELGLEIKGMSGDLSVSDLAAGVKAANFSGDIIVQKSSGAIALESKSGDIEVLGCEGEIRVHTLSGDIDLERIRSVMVQAQTLSGELQAQVVAAGEIDLQSTSGDIRLELPEDSACELAAETASGAVACELPVDYRERSASRIVGSLHGGGPKVTLRTTSGDIAVSGS